MDGEWGRRVAFLVDLRVGTICLSINGVGPDDNRFDLRPFLYNIKFDWQFAAIDQRLVKDSLAEQPREAGTVNLVTNHDTVISNLGLPFWMIVGGVKTA